MRYDNHVLEALERDDAAIGARATTLDPLVVEVYGTVGLDFAWLDLEHTGPSAFDSGALERLTRAGEVAGVEPLVRVPSGDPELIRTVLDAGVRSILVPRVETAGDIEPAIRASQFEYDGGPGGRGAAAARTNCWGAAGANPDREDESVLVGAMLESRTAVENVGDVLSVPELGFAFVGPSDLSISLGRPYETDHPDVRAATETIRDAALDAAVPVGCIADGGEAARDAIDEGYRILRVGDEVGAAKSVLGGRVASIRDAE